MAIANSITLLEVPAELPHRKSVIVPAVLTAISVLFLSTGQSRATNAPSASRAVTVADAIAMTRLGDPLYVAGLSSTGLVAHYSPDGKRFVVILRKGDLKTNVNTYSLLLFQTARLFRSPLSRVLVSLSNSSNTPAIKNVVWLADNDTILFLGKESSRHSQIYSIKCSSGKLAHLTHHSTNVTSFTATSEGDQLLYSAESLASSLPVSDAGHIGISLTTERLADVIIGRFGGGTYDDHELYIWNRRDNTSRRMQVEGRIIDPEAKLLLSPDGRYFVLQTMVRKVPREWGDYQTGSGTMQALSQRSQQQGPATGVFQWELLNTATGRGRLLLDAPVGQFLGGSEAAWSPDSSSVVVAHVYLPLNVSSPAELAFRKSHTVLAEVKLPSMEVRQISSDDLRLLNWDPQVNVITCDLGRIDSFRGVHVQKVYFGKSADKWVRVDPPIQSRTHLPQIVLKEDPNLPPRIMAIDAANGAESLIMELNPQFRNLRFGRVEQLKWKDKLGNDVHGGLYWPPNYIQGKKYPLVIQTHGFNPNRFWIDGPWTTAFAAQPLVNKDIFVLQVPDPDWHLLDTPEEAPRAVASYEGAIDYLDGRGLINNDRIGIVGFSRTCFYVAYMLTHSKYNIAAAAMTDGIDGGYFQYVALSNSVPLLAAAYEKFNGGVPYGKALSSWADRSPEFRMNSVRTPLRVEAIGPDSLISEWAWLAGLSRLGKPIEMIYIPDGTHVLERPWDRMISQQGNVDWFCFWLKGEEDPNPLKVSLYKRWRGMRRVYGSRGDQPTQ